MEKLKKTHYTELLSKILVAANGTIELVSANYCLDGIEAVIKNIDDDQEYIITITPKEL